MIETLATKAYLDQKTGTSGLRKKTSVFMQENYMANWIESLFSAMKENGIGFDGTLVVGGDGRYGNELAIDLIIKIGVARGFKRILVGQHGLMSTPALSAVVRDQKALGGIILTASHNPGGKNGDMGMKFNPTNGGPAPESFTDIIYKHTTQITEISMETSARVDIHVLGTTTIGSTVVEVTDPTATYAELMQTIFDFDAIRALAKTAGFKFFFDGMHGVTGPYAQRIFGEILGFPSSFLLRCDPKPDFGGLHPDPNLTYAKDLVELCYADNKVTVAAASDGDGDRNMILGDNFFVTPSDSVAVIADKHQAIPYFKNGLKGVARSMPTSAALDVVAKKLNLEVNSTPTGWKFFTNLMDADRCSICGEESFGTSSDHIREKDGLWAVLAWLNIIAVARQTDPTVTVQTIVESFWRENGRNAYQRLDYEALTTEQGKAVMDAAAAAEGAVDFRYVDPVDGSVAEHQGIIVPCDGGRFVVRTSGTGSSGATVRVYIEKEVAKDDADLLKPASELLAGMEATALAATKLVELTGRAEPTVRT
ncbi:Alpha-D-phosphohexomutase superfamily [Carpediemonas membranifera]|uniref:phosphoglucomutase (alpha-D-glucose-1,6-bisphosphate-dependent) n=1 Tax=Carpediemonas membranifera TaxID=201153 RepID=A0A8J6B414_9EUKA|nr:Alpha-D-phosphohexomutase superfamily [Carpediemonas membranifera]|eukprot:KAG9392534.1 Alpha-D-phosphohexomutase superfamily [Carpediemonas membranifera]